MSSEKAVQEAPRRGALIIFEGLDRCGKTTQCKQLVAALQQEQVQVEHLSFPDRKRPTGVLIDKFLRKEIELDPVAVHLLFSTNRQECRAELLAKLQAGTTYVVDRYAYSGAAFTAAQLPVDDPAGRDLRWCQEADRGMPAPDVVIGLELAPDAAANRGGYGGEAYENVGFQNKVQLQFNMLAEATPQWVRVDASGSVEQVASRVYKIASDAIAACQRGLPIELLWNTADAALGSRAEASRMTIADATSPGHDRVGIEAAAVSKRARQGAADRAVLGSLNGG